LPNLQLDDRHESYTYSLEAPISLMRWYPDGRYLAMVANRKLHKWDNEEGGIVRQQTLRGEENTVDLNISLSHAVAVYRGNQISVQRLGPGFVPIPWQKHYDKFKKLAWAPNKSHIAAVVTNELIVFSLKTRNPIPLTRRIQTDTSIQAVCWSHDSAHVVACTQGREVHVVNVKARRIVTVFKHTSQVLQAEISRDNQSLVIAARDGTISLFNLQTLDESQVPYATLPSVGSAIKTIDFSADNSLMAARLSNEYVYVWSLKNQRLVDIIRTQCTISNGLAFHPSEPKLAMSVNADGANTFAIYSIPDNIHDLVPQVDIIKKRIAKIVIVGDRYVGKSTIFKNIVHKYEKVQDNVAIIPFENAMASLDGELGVKLEMWLWDTPTAPDSLLLSELEMRNIAISIIVFDGTKNKYKQSINHWLSRLHRVRGDFITEASAILAESNIESGLSNVQNGKKIDTKLGYRTLFKVDSSGENAEDLLLEIFKAIDWRNIQKGVYTEQFENINQFLFQINLTQNAILVSITQLFNRYMDTHVTATLRSVYDIYQEFESCITFLEMQGIVRRFRYGGLVLLTPNVLNVYLTKILDYVSSKDEIGAINIQEILQVDFGIDEHYRLDDAYLENALRLAIVDDLLANDIAYREGDVLHFPHLYQSPISLFKKEKEQADYEYVVDEPLGIIYSQIVNRLRILKDWEFNGFEKGGAGFSTPEGEPFLVSYESNEYSGTLSLSFSKVTHQHSRCLLDLVIQLYLKELTIDAEVSRTRLYKCEKCGEYLSAEQSRALDSFEMQQTHIPCNCGHTIMIVDECTDKDVLHNLRERFNDMSVSIKEAREERMKKILLENKHTLNMYDAIFVFDKDDEYHVQNFHTYLRNEFAIYAEIQRFPMDANKIANMRRYDEQVVFFLGQAKLSEKNREEIVRLADAIGTVNRKIILVMFGTMSRAEDLYNHPYIELMIMFDDDVKKTLNELGSHLTIL